MIKVVWSINSSSAEIIEVCSTSLGISQQREKKKIELRFSKITRFKITLERLGVSDYVTLNIDNAIRLREREINM
jgi:hypothetical protein